MNFPAREVENHIGQSQWQGLIPDEILMEQPDEKDRGTVGQDPHKAETDELTMSAGELFPVEGPYFIEGKAEKTTARAADKIGAFR